VGVRAVILRSQGEVFPLELIPPRIEVVSVPAKATSVFEHDVSTAERAMRVPRVAAPLSENDVPDDWRDASLVLLAPVINEVQVGLVGAFGDASIAAAAQGWLRGLHRDGAVRTIRWDAARQTLRGLQALFVSAEDERGQEAAMTEWVQRVPIAVVASGADTVSLC